MNAPAIAQQQGDSTQDLAKLVDPIAALESLVGGWDEPARSTAQALKSAIEDLNREAFKRLIRLLKDDPAAGARLREALGDPVIYAVLLFHGLVREPLEARVHKALNEVRPFMHEHGGDVELVAIKAPDTVELRLVGSCHGCPASSQTLTEGVERALREHCPEIVHVNQVSRGPATVSAEAGSAVLHFVSPFARHASDTVAAEAESGWDEVLPLQDIPDGGILVREVRCRSVLFHRVGTRVSCLDNRCAHLGMELDMGEIAEGTITCPYHGFKYLLETGECLTVPEVQLTVHAVRVVGDRVQVRLET